MILHHYNLSPFSEKIRLMLGHSGLAWSSVISPAMPPRPVVDPLAGGYRRIPVGQIGADLFCDTRIISSEIANLSGKPGLAKENCNDQINGFVDHVDSTVFMAIVRTGEPLRSLGLMLMNFAPWQVVRFMNDRAAIGRASLLPRVSHSQAQEIVSAFKADIDSRLSSNDFLFGDEPSIADFSAYHLLWFARKISHPKPCTGYPNSEQWMARMDKIGHGKSTKMSKSAVFKIAAKSSPRPIPKAMQDESLIGQKVEICPNDYARNAVQGKLLGSSDLRWILERRTAEFDCINVHFPKQGFDINPL